MKLIGTVYMNEQENEGVLDFLEDNQCVMTSNFKATFGDEAETIILVAMALVMHAHPKGADYFQTFYYEYPDGKQIKFWIIIDEMGEGEKNILTALLPEDY